jgi:hypothetical protein
VKRIAAIKLEGDTERVRREHHDAIVELQSLPAAGMRVIEGVTLADGVTTPVAHGLGRLPVWICPSAPRNATSTGRIIEVRSGSYDRSKVVALQATGWGATITIDVVAL